VILEACALVAISMRALSPPLVGDQACEKLRPVDEINSRAPKRASATARPGLSFSESAPIARIVDADHFAFLTRVSDTRKPSRLCASS
jgi:hypothetical protein